jgi:hypothetical protein
MFHVASLKMFVRLIARCDQSRRPRVRRCKFCGHSFVGIKRSNTARTMKVCSFWIFCAPAKFRSLVQRSPTECVCLCACPCVCVCVHNCQWMWSTAAITAYPPLRWEPRRGRTEKNARNDDILLYLLLVKSCNAYFGFNIMFHVCSSDASLLVSLL